MAGNETKYLFNISPFEGVFTAGQVRKILPQHFSVRESEDVLEVTISDGLPVEDVRSQVEQECDRIFFLTGVQVSPKFFGIQEQDGRIRCTTPADFALRIVEPLAHEIARQDWSTTNLHVQLRLWQLAQQVGLQLSAKIIYLFQIIEVDYPETSDCGTYPPYECEDTAPEPRTEAKLLRDLASHGRKKMKNPQLNKYCNYLGISSQSHNPRDATFLKALGGRLSIIAQQARETIEINITRR